MRRDRKTVILRCRACGNVDEVEELVLAGMKYEYRCDCLGEMVKVDYTETPSRTTVEKDLASNTSNWMDHAARFVEGFPEVAAWMLGVKPERLEKEKKLVETLVTGELDREEKD